MDETSSGIGSQGVADATEQSTQRRTAILSEADAPSIGRYRVETVDEVRFIVSVSAPNVGLRVEPGLAVTKRGLRRFGRQIIFLDGAFSGAPFHDNERRQYSLDHHDGCVRIVTLSTCEQAAVVLITGLPINDGRWTLVINEPDLDAILACWVLMNHIDLLCDGAKLLADAMPLIRTEGNIDTYGFGKEVLTTLPPETYRQQQERLDMLSQPIKELKRLGKWTSSEYEDVVLRTLDAIDHLILPGVLIEQLLEYKEFGRIRLRGSKIAILCRSTHGIYEVEEHLRIRYGKLLGIIVLDQGVGKYTVRRSDEFLSHSLLRLYKALNRIDRNATPGKQNENRWGGADDIGGSPRTSGSALSGEEILEGIKRIYGEPQSLWHRILQFMIKQ
jgi:hypothetical protein